MIIEDNKEKTIFIWLRFLLWLTIIRFVVVLKYADLSVCFFALLTMSSHWYSYLSHENKQVFATTLPTNTKEIVNEYRQYEMHSLKNEEKTNKPTSLFYKEIPSNAVFSTSITSRPRWKLSFNLEILMP